MTVKPVNPLTWNIPIVDDKGRPTPEFMHKWAQQQAINDSAAAGADPTATASDVAVPGTLKTFMRSDAAPAVQKASASKFGLVKPDGTTITSSDGVITAPDIPSGFGFFIGGLMSDHELLAGFNFPLDVVFSDGDPKTIVECVVPPAADADMTLVANPVGLSPTSPVTVGTVHFAAGAFTATVTWTGSPYTLAAGTPLLLYAPTPADVQLALVSGTINGSPA